MANAVRPPRIGNLRSQSIGDPEPPLDFGQQQKPAVRAQPTTVEGDTKVLAFDA